jgi:hypothetical protein
MREERETEVRWFDLLPTSTSQSHILTTYLFNYLNVYKTQFIEKESERYTFYFISTLTKMNLIYTNKLV